MKNTYEIYLEDQLKDPEFAALYALEREKVKLEIYLERLKENIKDEADKRVIMRNLNKITRYVKGIAL
ncbi:hypothetical protein ACFLSQ_08850 [Bacteroidota bacterium]